MSNLTVDQFADSIKQRYPQYKNIENTLLTEKMIQKFPQYKNSVNFSSAVPVQQDKVLIRPPEQTFKTRKEAEQFLRTGVEELPRGEIKAGPVFKERVEQRTTEEIQAGERLQEEGKELFKGAEGITRNIDQVRGVAAIIGGRLQEGASPISAFLEESTKPIIDFITETPTAELLAGKEGVQEAAKKLGEVIDASPDLRAALQILEKVPATVAFTKFLSKARGLTGVTEAKQAKEKLELGREFTTITEAPKAPLKKDIEFNPLEVSRPVETTLKTLAEGTEKISTFRDLVDSINKGIEKRLKIKDKVFLGTPKTLLKNPNALSMAKTSQNTIKNVDGLVDEKKFLDDIIVKLEGEGVDIKALDKLKTTTDDIEDIFKTAGAGDVKAGVKAKGFKKQRDLLKKDIEEFVKQTTGEDIKVSNEQISDLIKTRTWASGVAANFETSPDPEGFIRRILFRIPVFGGVFQKTGVKEAARRQKGLKKLVKKTRKSSILKEPNQQ